MSQRNQDRRNTFIKKIVSNSRAIITHQVAIPLGSQTMAKILYWINNIDPLVEIDLNVFSVYNKEIQHLPIGIERLSYNKELLMSEDFLLDHITAKYKNEIINKCFEIIKVYDVK